MQDLDAFDALHRLDALADDAFHLVDQPHTQQRHARVRRQHVVRFIHQTRAFGFDFVPNPECHRADLVRVGLRLGLRAQCVAAIG